MESLATIYDRAFFTNYGAHNAEYARACYLIAKELAARFQPRTAVDWGCGSGLHASGLQQHGVKVIGVDGVRVDDDLVARNVTIKQADLTAPIPADLTWPGYDLSLCIDVMEHLDDNVSEVALSNILRGAGLAILSCAPPGQGGHHHVNERPRRYWVARLAALGWKYQRRETGLMERYFLGQRDQLTQSWMYHNLCVYRPE